MRQYVLQYQYLILRKTSAIFLANKHPKLFTTRFEADDDKEAGNIATDWVIRNRNWLRINGNREVTLWCFPDEYTLAYLVELYEVPDTKEGMPLDYERWDKIEKLEIRMPPAC